MLLKVPGIQNKYGLSLLAQDLSANRDYHALVPIVIGMSGFKNFLFKLNTSWAYPEDSYFWISR